MVTNKEEENNRKKNKTKRYDILQATKKMEHDCQK
jgi:hypothetical protein